MDNLKTLDLSGEFNLIRGIVSSCCNPKNDLPKLTAVFTPSREFDYENLIVDNKPSKFGEFVINQDVLGRDFNEDVVYTPDFSEFVGRPFYEVFNYLTETFSSDFYMAGIEYQSFLYKNPEKISDILRFSKSYYYFFGSLYRNSNGRWCIPSSLVSESVVLGGSWIGSHLVTKRHYKAVLIKKESSEL